MFGPRDDARDRKAAKVVRVGTRSGTGRTLTRATA